MGHKLVCLDCHRVENLGLDLTNLHIGKCPICSHEMMFVNHNFRPPKKNDKKGWELVKFLISEGFPFQHVYQEGKSYYFRAQSENYVSYPKDMAETKEFVIKYREQRIIKSNE